jgi:TPR repeat protein
VHWFKRRIGLREKRRDVSAEARAAFEAGDYTTALSLWEPLAHAGVARAQNNIGVCFSDGLGVERDPELAVRWLSLAAAGGDPLGQRNLATAISTAWALRETVHVLPSSIGPPRSKVTPWPRTC